MIDKQIVKVLKALGSFDFRVNSEGVRTNCPLQWNHAHMDQHPSMFIYSSHPRNGKPSVAWCHTCQFKGTLSTLLWEIKKQKTVSRELMEYVDRCESGEDEIQLEIDLMPEYGEIPNHVRHIPAARIAAKSNHVMESSSIILRDQNLEIKSKEYGIAQAISFQDMEAMIVPYLAKVPPYWFERGYDMETAKKWFIGLQENVYHRKLKGNKHYYLDQGPRLLFGIKDFRQYWVGWSARAMHAEEKLQVFQHPDNSPIYRSIGSPKYLHAPSFKRNNYLYGENAIDCNVKTCFLCEGFFDVINISRHGFKNPLGMFGTALSDPQIEKIKQWFNTVIFFPDGDEPGIKAMEIARKQLCGKVRFIGIDPKDYMGRDPGDLTFDEMNNVIINHF